MYTDVVGYSKLTGDNQKLALVILEEHNKILNRFTNRYSGKVVKLTGDGLCALFDSPISAIKSAIDIQKALDKRNKLNAFTRKIIEKSPPPSTIRLNIDVDPYTFT